MRINALLDAGLRRHDEIMAAAAIFNKLKILNPITTNFLCDLCVLCGK
jgi:hypothetical protein